MDKELPRQRHEPRYGVRIRSLGANLKGGRRALVGAWRGSAQNSQYLQVQPHAASLARGSSLFLCSCVLFY